MKKKLLSFIFAFLLCVSLIPATLADSDKSIVYDQEGLFDEFDTEIISGKLAELNRIYSVDVAVVTTFSLAARQPRNTPTIFMTKTTSARAKTRTAYFFL